MMIIILAGIGVALVIRDYRLAPTLGVQMTALAYLSTVIVILGVSLGIRGIR